MKFQLPYLVVVMATILFTISIMDDENTILDLENQLQQVNGWEEMHEEDEQVSHMTHRKQCYYDRSDHVQGRLERGEICETQAAELRMGA